MVESGHSGRFEQSATFSAKLIWGLFKTELDKQPV